MSNLQTPFRYDFVGSFLRPERLKEARKQYEDFANQGIITPSKMVPATRVYELVEELERYVH